MKKRAAVLFIFLFRLLSLFPQDNMFVYSISLYANGVSVPLTNEHNKMEIQQVYHTNGLISLWTYYWKSEEPSRTVWDFQICYINPVENVLYAIDGNDSAFYSFAIQKPVLKFLGHYSFHSNKGEVYNLGMGDVITIYTSHDYPSRANLGITDGSNNLGAIVRMVINNGKTQCVFQLEQRGKSSKSLDKLTWKENKISGNQMDKLLVIAWLISGFDL
jgi:hypothetical protein